LGNEYENENEYGFSYLKKINIFENLPLYVFGLKLNLFSKENEKNKNWIPIERRPNFKIPCRYQFQPKYDPNNDVKIALFTGSFRFVLILIIIKTF